jgi:hypothetical protein
VLLTAIQESHRPTALATPASTPRNEAVSTPLPSRNIAQGYDHSPDNADQQTIHDRSSPNIQEQHEACLSDPPRRGTSAVEHESGNGPQYRTYCEEADGLETERTEDSLLADPGDSVDGQIGQRSGRPLRQAAQSAASLITQQLDKAPYRPRKRKHVSEGSDDADCIQSTASGAAESDPERPSPAFSELADLPSLPTSDGGPVSAPAATPQSTPGTVSSSQGSPPTSRSPEEHISLPNRDGQFTDLDEDLRAKAQAIADRDTLEDAWHIFNYMSAQRFSPTAYCSTVSNPGVVYRQLHP